MTPLIQLDDYLLVEPTSLSSTKDGDLLVIQRGNDVITHRLINKSSGFYLTKGDNCRLLDPPIAIGDPDVELVGKVIALERKGRTVDFQSGFWSRVNKIESWIGQYESHPHSLRFGLTYLCRLFEIVFLGIVNLVLVKNLSQR